MQAYFNPLNTLFFQFREIKLAYLFGSQANHRVSPLSDYDFAVYLDPATEIVRQKDILLGLIAEITSILKSDQIDVVILNQCSSLLLKYNVIKEGILIFQRPPYKLLVEPVIYSQYFDFKVFMQNYESRQILNY